MDVTCPRCGQPDNCGDCDCTPGTTLGADGTVREARIVSVEYMVGLGAKVNLDTGQVEAVVVWPDDFNVILPMQYWAHHDTEYLDADHPDAKRALEIVELVRVDVGDLRVPFTLWEPWRR